MNAKNIVAVYFLAQSVATATWWALLWFWRESVKWFQPEAWPTESLSAFWLADLVLLVGGSLVVAFAIGTSKSWAKSATWALVAVVWYPTLYCIGVSILTHQAWIASAMMASMSGLTLAMATVYGNENQFPATIRVTPMTKTTAICWTFAQTAVFWSTFLWILPRGIVELEGRLGVPLFSHQGQSIGAIVALIAGSALGLWSGITMATRGDGTPLPTATAPKLVVSGPYRFVRNPMAAAGIVQGIAVGWLLGSYSVIALSITGAFVWHLVVRPIEEADLANRFGQEYSRYQQRVRLWFPAATPSDQSTM